MHTSSQVPVALGAFSEFAIEINLFASDDGWRYPVGSECCSNRNTTMVESKFECRDCGSAMQPIKLIDATDGPGWDKEGVQHVELGYASPDANRSFFMGKIERIGSVKGRICPDCGRMLLYGEKSV